MTDQTKQHPRTLDEETLMTIAGRRAYAHREISQLCSGQRRWTMSVPVREDDSDMVFGGALDDIETLTKEVYRLRGALRQLYVEHWGELPTEATARIQAALYGTGDAIDTPEDEA